MTGVGHQLTGVGTGVNVLLPGIYRDSFEIANPIGTAAPVDYWIR